MTKKKTDVVAPDDDVPTGEQTPEPEMGAALDRFARSFEASARR